MHRCNTVLQSENDLFEPEIQPNFSYLIRTIKSSKCFGHCPVKGKAKGKAFALASFVIRLEKRVFGIFSGFRYISFKIPPKFIKNSQNDLLFCEFLMNFGGIKIQGFANEGLVSVVIHFYYIIPIIRI